MKPASPRPNHRLLDPHEEAQRGEPDEGLGKERDDIERVCMWVLVFILVCLFGTAYWWRG